MGKKIAGYYGCMPRGGCSRPRLVFLVFSRYWTAWSHDVSLAKFSIHLCVVRLRFWRSDMFEKVWRTLLNFDGRF